MTRRAALIELNVAVFLFGLSGLFGKWISADPTTIVFGRTAFASLAILVGLRIVGLRIVVGSPEFNVLVISSGFVLALHWVTFFHAIQISTVAIGLVGFATFPVFVTLLEPLVFRVPLRGIDVLCASVVCLGLFLVTPSFSLSNVGTIGLLWAILSGLLFAVLTLINRKLVGDHPFLVIAFYQHGVAALAMLPFAVSLSAMPETNTLWLIAILGIACTAVPQTLFIKSLQVVRAQLASVVTGLEPVYGIVFAALLLGEVPAPRTVVGAMLVLCGVLFATKAHAMGTGAEPDER